uniref:Peroxiredoxin n=1 Tax=Candidatus Kentrum eta TaxID=2126337 RepID=A0A450V8C9_9GAMM|nr:MAG: Peroxiredoxin [Candidatus Kentron sp. H]VFJ94434.1 MAG: Peroxiredoxin [Candidatus Kentron sp. H]VFK01082.1 MAG: Peroxiredoxin [Candidatus Kentron sp. H]
MCWLPIIAVNWSTKRLSICLLFPVMPSLVNAILFIFAIFLLIGCTSEAPQSAHGQPTPAFTLTRLEGGTLAFPDALRGQVVAIRFWADWCPFCAPEMKAIEPVFRHHRERGLAILAVNVRQDHETVSAFVKRLDISYDVLLDENGEVARAYGVMGLPITFLLDRQGRLRTRILGESSAEVFERVVLELLE